MPNQNITTLEQQENGSFKELVIGKRKKFTPPTTGRWYRIVRVISTNEIRRVISGTLKIYADAPDNKINATFDIDISFDGRGTITQTNYNRVGGQIVTFLRSARRQGAGKNEIVLDMLVEGGSGIEMTLESVGPLFPDFEDNPQIVGSVQWNTENFNKPWDSHVMEGYKYGFDTAVVTPTPPTPAPGQSVEVDVAFWFEQNTYSATILNSDISQEATLYSIGTDSQVYLQFYHDVGGIKEGIYGGRVLSAWQDNVALRNIPTTDSRGTAVPPSQRYRVIVRLKLDSTSWLPGSQSAHGTYGMTPGFYYKASPDQFGSRSWTLRIVTGVFNGLIPENPVNNDGEHQASILRLGNGLTTNKNVNVYHGNLQDPGAPLQVGGRVGYLHGLDLLGGGGRFTSAADHFHLGFIGAVNSGAGFRTPQHYSQYKLGFFDWNGRQMWRNWQMQNANNADANEIFLGGVTQFFFGQGEVSGTVPYGIDTRRVELTGGGISEGNTSPAPPRWDAEVDFWFNNNFTVSTNQFLITRFPVGVAGIAAAVLSGTVVAPGVQGPLTAPNGVTGKYKLTIRIQGLNPNEWYPFMADFTTVNSTGPSRWSIESSTPPIQPTNQTSLTLVPGRRDKLVASWSQPHGLTLGQNIILNLLNKSFVVSNPARLNCTVLKVIDANTIEILIGTARRLETAMVGVYEFKAPGDHNLNGTLGNSEDFCLLINAFPSDNNTRLKFRANISGTTMTVTEMLSTGYNIEPKMNLFSSNGDETFNNSLATGARIVSQVSGTAGGVGTYTIAWTGGSLDRTNSILYAGKIVHRVKFISNAKLPEPLVENVDYYVRVSNFYPQYHAWFYTTELDAFNGQTGINAPTVKFPWKPTYGTYWAVFQDAQDLDATGWSVHIGNTDPGHQQTFADVGWYLHRNVYPDAAGVAQGVITQGIFGGISSVEWYRKNSFIYGFNCTNQADNTITLGQKLTNKTPNSTEIGSTDAIKLRLNGDDIVVSDDTRNLRIAEIFNQNGQGNQLILSNNKVWLQSFYGDISVTIPSGPNTWARIVGGGPGDTTCTVTLPRQGVDGAVAGDELLISLESIVLGRSVILRQYQWAGSSYTSTFTNVPAGASSGTYTSDTMLRLKLRDGAWHSVGTGGGTGSVTDINSGQALTFKAGSLGLAFETDLIAPNAWQRTLTNLGLRGTGFASFQGASFGNVASGEYSVTLGAGLEASGNYSFAAGRNAKANHQGAFVWADSQTADFISNAVNTFNVRAAGGMRLDLGTVGITFISGAAETRTNLGLGATNDVTFKNLFVTGDYVGSPPPSSGSLAQFGEAMNVFTNYIQASVPIYFDQAATTRTNLGAAPIASPTFTGTVTIPAGASISGFAPLASPTFTGTPAAPTATAGTNTTQLATTAFVQTGLSGKENSLGQGTSAAQFLRGDKTWQVPAGAFGPLVLNRFRNLLFASSNYNPGATAFSPPSSNGFFTMTPFGNTLEGGTFGVGTPRTFNPEIFFGPGSNYRIFAAVRTTSWFNDGVHCMIRSWDGSTQTTVPGLQDFGGGAATGDRIVWSTSEPIASTNTWFNYAAYFAAYGNNNNSNGATIQDVILTFYKVT